MSGSEEDNEAARADQLRRAMATIERFELRRQDNGTYQIVLISDLTGAALPYEDDMTLDDVERWVKENVVDDDEQE